MFLLIELYWKLEMMPDLVLAIQCSASRVNCEST